MDNEKLITFSCSIEKEENGLAVSSSTASIVTPAAQTNSIHRRRGIGQNFFLIWLTTDIEQSQEDSQNMQEVVSDINHFIQPDECIDFLTDIDDRKGFLIISNTLGQQIVPLIHDIPQLHSIYIFSGSNSNDEQWIKEWVKIKGIHTEAVSINESLQQTMQQYNRDSIAISVVTANEKDSIQNLNQLEPAFMYTQIFKEILLEMNDNQLSMKDMILFWRDCYVNNNSKLHEIDVFERDYHSQSSIWWYTREAFIYQMLNRALRLIEGDTIINMGFFIRHLHHQIQELYRQKVHVHHGQPFIVYRGQGLSTDDFEKLSKTNSCLISFNNFLSTSMDENVSRMFAESSSANTDTVGVLFKMTIDPSVSSAPFASIQEVSSFGTEEEILFSMHTVFRVRQITELNNSGTLYQVNLTLTADDDHELRTLTERIREEVKGTTGWKRIALLLIKLNQLDTATELYKVLLEQTSNCDDF